MEQDRSAAYQVALPLRPSNATALTIVMFGPPAAALLLSPL